MNEGRIVKYTTKFPRQARRNIGPLPVSSVLWLIEYKDGSYFHCGYVHKVSAAMVKDNLTGDTRERMYNSTKLPEFVLHSDITPQQVAINRLRNKSSLDTIDITDPAVKQTLDDFMNRYVLPNNSDVQLVIKTDRRKNVRSDKEK